MIGAISKRSVLALLEVRPFRILFTLWALAAAATLVHIAMRYPVDHWQAVVACAIVAVATVAAPMDRRARMALAVILAVAFRSLAWRSFADVPLSDDPGYFNQLSDGLLAGAGLQVDDPVYGSLQAAFPPLYPILLAGWKAFGGHWLGLNIVIDLAAAAAVFLLSGRSARAAAAYLLFPSVLYAAILPGKEGLASLLVLLCMLALRRSALLYGVLTGLVALAQPAWLPIPIVAFVLVRRSWRDCLIAPLGGVLVLAPWWLRNAIVLDAFVPLTSSAGLSLSVAVHGEHLPPPDMAVGEVQRSADAARHAIAHMAADPVNYLINVAKMLTRSLMVDDDTIDYLALTNAPWRGAAAWVGQCAWVALLAGAARAAWHRHIQRDSTIDAFFLGWMAACALGMWLEFATRHRAFAVPILILWLAAYWARSATVDALPNKLPLSGSKIERR